MEIEKRLPKYHETFIPVLDVLKDGMPMHYMELKKRVRDKYYSDLPSHLLELKTKSGDQLILNRIGWAKVYLKEAGLVAQPERAMVQITSRGLNALKKGSLTLQELKNDPVYLEARAFKKKLSNESLSNDEASPQDLIDEGVQTIEDEIKSDLLSRLKTIDPYYFEQVVNDLFERMGYGGAKTTVKSGDKGVDGVINQDELGLEKIYIQAKRFNEHNVREPDIRNFIGAMSGDTQKGIFVTTSAFDSKAIEKARDANHKIILIDGAKLADLLYRFGVGVQVASIYEIKEIDEDYFVR